MKKTLTVAVAGLLALSLIPAAHAAKKPKQTESGTIVAPLPFTDDSGCYAGVWRRAHAFTGDAGRGPIGWNFAVDKATWNKKFDLEVSGGIGSPDMDIYFYLAPLTTPEDFVAQQGDPVAPPTISYNTREPGGEEALVPKGAQNAVICMYGGAQGTGAAADFTYTAGSNLGTQKEGAFGPPPFRVGLRFRYDHRDRGLVRRGARFVVRRADRTLLSG